MSVRDPQASEFDQALMGDFTPLTADLDPIEFRSRVELEDFEVTELPLIESSGEGTHLWFELEKRGLSTRAALARIARALGKRELDFGYAGLKDARALTRQTVSVEHVEPAALSALELSGLRIGKIRRHPRRLRVGALRGNRFRLVLRGLRPAARGVLESALERLCALGLPNYYGVQRFGHGARNADQGRALVAGNFEEFCRGFLGCGPEGPPAAAGHPGRERAALLRRLAARPADWRDAARAVPRRTRQLLVSALQSRVFNRVLAQRVRAAALARLELGDVAYRHAGGASFLVGVQDLEGDSEHEALAPRLARFELSPSGPIPGHRMLEGGGPVASREAAALALEGLSLADFRGLGMGLDQRGARRPLRVPLSGVSVEHAEDRARLVFELPKGAYASTLLAELSKRPG